MIKLHFLRCFWFHFNYSCSEIAWDIFLPCSHAYLNIQIYTEGQKRIFMFIKADSLRMIIFIRSSKLYIKFCFSKFYVPCLDQTVRLHVRVDMMLLFKGLWKNFSIYNYIAVLELFLKSCGILKSIGWRAQLLIGKCRFHFPFSVIYICDSCRKGFWHCIWDLCAVNLYHLQSGDESEI